MNPELVVAMVAGLVGTGGLASVFTALRNRTPKETVIAVAAEKTVVTMGRALDAMEKRAVAAETERDEALAKLAEMEGQLTALKRQLDDALFEIKKFRDQLGNH